VRRNKANNKARTIKKKFIIFFLIDVLELKRLL
jgi:hypothetical protein